MALISKITKQKKNQEFYNIYIEGEFAFGIHGELLLLYGLKEGRNIDLEEMKEIIQEDQKKRAFHRALHYLSHKRRTQWEIETYLNKKEYPEEIIQKVIDKLKGYGMIDDEAYVGAFVSDKKLGNPMGRKKLQYDLEKRGIPEKLLQNLDQWFPQEEEFKQAQRLVEIYNRKYGALPQKERIRKINQAGQRRGFSWEMMKRAIQDVEIIRDEVESEKSPEVNMEKAIQWGKKYATRYEKKGFEGYVLKQKIARAMMGRGYSWTIVEEVLQKVLSQPEA